MYTLTVECAATGFARVALTDCTLGKYKVPKGALLLSYKEA